MDYAMKENYKQGIGYYPLKWKSGVFDASNDDLNIPLFGLLRAEISREVNGIEFKIDITINKNREDISLPYSCQISATKIIHDKLYVQEEPHGQRFSEVREPLIMNLGDFETLSQFRTLDDAVFNAECFVFFLYNAMHQKTVTEGKLGEE